MLESVRVGRFSVADAVEADLVSTALSSHAQLAMYALHVGGLNHSNDDTFVEAMNAADVCYADGASVVLLARIAGARKIRRSPTTDIGLPIIESLSARGRGRVAIIGGEEGLATLAAARIESLTSSSVVYATHGFHDQWDAVVAAVESAGPDIVIVGMGMPKEAKWVHSYRDQLPDNAVILTCGGWLGFLAGDEPRAPRWMQIVGAEWVFRLRWSRGRLLMRYAIGVLTASKLIPVQYLRRVRMGATQVT